MSVRDNLHSKFSPFSFILKLLKHLSTIHTRVLIRYDGFGLGIWKHQNIETPVVCNVLDVSGELAAAVASVEAIVSYRSIKEICLFMRVVKLKT